MFRNTRRMRLAAVATAVATAAALSLAGCSSDAPKGDTLTFAANSQPTSLDPALQSVDQVNNFYVNIAYDTLTKIDGEGKVVPDLAESWKYTDGSNKVFELKLRDAKFSDGTAVTAQAVADSLNYVRTKGVNGPNWLSSVTSVTATDAKTVTIQNSEPNDSLPMALSQRMLLGSIINPTGLADVTKLKTATYGAGPYVLDPANTVAGDHYTYLPNQYYWDKSKQHWNKVVIKVAGNATSSLKAVQNGEADFMSGDATTGTAARNAGMGVTTANYGLTGINIMDRDGTVVPELKNVKVRQALLYAIDRDAIQKAVFPGFATPSFGIYVKGFPGYAKETSDAYAFDMTKAQQLMTESGVKPFSVNVAAPTANNTNIMAQAVKEAWAKLGVTMNITTYTDLGQMTKDILAQKFPITAYNYGALPSFIESKSFFSGGKTQFNAFNTTTPEITAALNKSTDEGYAQAAKIAQVDLAWMSATYVRDQIAIFDKNKVTGFQITSVNPIPDIWNITVAK